MYLKGNNKIMEFNKIVNKLGRKGGKVIFKSDIFELIDPEQKVVYNNKVNKLIYRLKANETIINIKAGVYIVPDLEDKKLNKIDLIEKYYWQLLKKYIIFYVGNSYYISGTKSLEIHNKNFATGDKIFVINRSLNKKIKFGGFEIIFKTISGKQFGKKINLFSKFNKFTQKKVIEEIEFRISNLELSLVESALISDLENGFDYSLINKTIKKYYKIFDTDIFYEIGKYKYIMSFNRLKEFSKNIDIDLYIIFLNIIKRNGGLFIGEGLRGI